jgi:phosphoribosylanthranilate isomerase
MIDSLFGERTTDEQPRIKICGITNKGDALSAIEAGADALGFNLFPRSPRYIDIFAAGTWMSELPSAPAKIAVLVSPTLEKAIEIAQLPFIDALQLHGEETVEFCRDLAAHKIPFIKAFPVTDAHSLRNVSSFSTRFVLLDSGGAQGFGGSGQTFPWNLARKCVQDFPSMRMMLAGGLSPENVKEAIEQVRPFAVDVTTGVESVPGRKDRTKLRTFIAAARARPNA